MKKSTQKIDTGAPYRCARRQTRPQWELNDALEKDSEAAVLWAIALRSGQRYVTGRSESQNGDS